MKIDKKELLFWLKDCLKYFSYEEINIIFKHTINVEKYETKYVYNIQIIFENGILNVNSFTGQKAFKFKNRHIIFDKNVDLRMLEK